MKNKLKPSRYIHSLGVEEMAGRLAAFHGADIEKARFAGRYHDIAKCFDDEAMDSCILRYGLDRSLLGCNALAHSKIAAAILRNEFGVYDEEILNAVRSHTTGRSNMSLLEEIVYVADAIEDNRDYEGLKELQQLSVTDIDRACLFIMDYTLERIRAEGRIPDKDTIEAREYIIRKIESKGGSDE